MNTVFVKLDKLKPAFDRFSAVTLFICRLLLIADILVASYQVLSRFVSFLPDYPWTEEIVLTCMVYLTLISAALALRRNGHIRMTALDKRLPPKLLLSLDLLADVAVLCFALLMVCNGWGFAANSKGFYTSMPFVPKAVLFASVPIGGFFAIIVELELIYNHIKAFVVKKEAVTHES